MKTDGQAEPRKTFEFFSIGWIECCNEIYKSKPDLIEILRGFSAIVELGISEGLRPNVQIELVDGRSVYAGAPRPDKAPQFVLSATTDDWRRVMEGRQGVKAALITRRIKFKGPISVAFKYMRGLTGVIRMFGEVPTDFQD